MGSASSVSHPPRNALPDNYVRLEERFFHRTLLAQPDDEQEAFRDPPSSNLEFLLEGDLLAVCLTQKGCFLGGENRHGNLMVSVTVFAGPRG